MGSTSRAMADGGGGSAPSPVGALLSPPSLVKDTAAAVGGCWGGVTGRCSRARKGSSSMAEGLCLGLLGSETWSLPLACLQS